MSSSTIRIGTRGSKLALWQAEHVASLLKLEGVETEIVPIETLGDRVLDVSISKIGSKGVFTEEIEEQLQKGHIDIAVHSAKDMPSQLPDGFQLLAFTDREVVNDVLISHNKDFSLNNPSVVVGTSSTRRIATLKKYYPHVKTVPVRGNLQTRIGKMESGHCDALLLAYAGVHRMGYESMIVAKLPLHEFTPAVGQGSIAVEVFDSLSPDKVAVVRRSVNHPATEFRLLAERAFLRKMDGGCSIPVFGLATLHDDMLEIAGGVISLDGAEMVREKVSGPVGDARQLGESLGNLVLEKGGDRILKEIKNKIKEDQRQ